MRQLPIDVIWDGCSEGEANILETVQYEAVRVVTGAMKGTNKRRLLNELFQNSTFCPKINSIL